MAALTAALRLGLPADLTFGTRGLRSLRMARTSVRLVMMVPAISGGLADASSLNRISSSCFCAASRVTKS